jgi:predicted DNA-binding protein
MMKERTVEKRIGTSIPLELHCELSKIARKFGRSKSDLIKEGIWEVIKDFKNKKQGEV